MPDEAATLPPFKRSESPELGLTEATFRRLYKRGEIVRLGYGLYAGRDYLALADNNPERERVRAEAMLRRYPDAVVAGRCAAVIHRLWLLHRVGPVLLYRDRGWMRDRHDVIVETRVLPPVQVVVINGMRVTSVARSCVDAMRGSNPMEALALADSALRMGTTKDELLALLPESARDLRHVVALADTRSESALESASRWLFHRAGLPAPELQVTFDRPGGGIARVDFYWRKQHVIGEADGALKYDAEGKAKAAEEVRQSDLESLDETVVRWGWNDVMGDSSRLFARLREALGVLGLASKAAS